MANANALHWKAGLEQANIRNAELRTEKYQLRAFIRDLLDTGVISCGARRKTARELLGES